MKQKSFLGVGVFLVILAIGFAEQEDRKVPEEIEDETILEDTFTEELDGNDSFLQPRDPDKLYHYTIEEIDEFRWISIDRNGTESTATDEEVIAILESVRTNNSTSLVSEGHFPPDIPFDITEDKRSVFGFDGRFRRSSSSYPYCAIGQMANGCMAFLVGPYHAITSRQCVYDMSRRAWKPRRGLYLRRNCYSSGIFMDDVRTWTYTNNNGNDYDIAWILLDKSDYYSTCYMTYGYRDPMPTVSGEVCGYPTDKPIRSYRCLYCSRCSDIQRQGSWLSRNNRRLQYTCDTSRGMSGGPVFTRNHPGRNDEVAYGVHTHGGSTRNAGTRITKAHFQWTKQWKCNNGVRSSC